MKNNKGITLIALVITIIVMLILVAVTITMAVNGGLFTQAGKAKGDTQNAINAEKELANLPADMSTDQLIAKYTTGQGGNGGGQAQTANWTWTDSDESESINFGDLITRGTENFEIIAVGDSTVTAIAKQKVDTTTNKQSANAQEVKFDNEGDATSYDNASIKGLVNAYGNTLGLAEGESIGLLSSNDTDLIRDNFSLGVSFVTFWYNYLIFPPDSPTYAGTFEPGTGYNQSDITSVSALVPIVTLQKSRFI